MRGNYEHELKTRGSKPARVRVIAAVDAEDRVDPVADSGRRVGQRARGGRSRAVKRALPAVAEAAQARVGVQDD